MPFSCVLVGLLRSIRHSLFVDRGYTSLSKMSAAYPIRSSVRMGPCLSSVPLHHGSSTFTRSPAFDKRVVSSTRQHHAGILAPPCMSRCDVDIGCRQASAVYWPRMMLIPDRGDSECSDENAEVLFPPSTIRPWLCGKRDRRREGSRGKGSSAHGCFVQWKEQEATSRDETEAENGISMRKYQSINQSTNGQTGASRSGKGKTAPIFGRLCE